MISVDREWIADDPAPGAVGIPDAAAPGTHLQHLLHRIEVGQRPAQFELRHDGVPQRGQRLELPCIDVDYRAIGRHALPSAVGVPTTCRQTR